MLEQHGHDGEECYYGVARRAHSSQARVMECSYGVVAGMLRSGLVVYEACIRGSLARRKMSVSTLISHV